MAKTSKTGVQSKDALRMALALLSHLKYSSPGMAYVLDKKVRHYVDVLWKYGHYLLYLGGPEVYLPAEAVYDIAKGIATIYDAAVATGKSAIDLYKTRRADFDVGSVVDAVDTVIRLKKKLAPVSA